MRLYQSDPFLNGYDQFLRRTSLAALQLNNPLFQQSFGFDAASRLQTVSDGRGESATYSYLANSPLVGQIVFKTNSTTRMTATKQYDYLNRLTSISSQPAATGAASVSFNYNYNSANQRTQDKLADGSYWVYQYDALGQVTNGTKYFYDGTLVPGQQFDYRFDTIGNRTQTTAGGDQSGGSLRLASYSVNSLNQITSRDYPGTNDVIGAALATNSVTVNGQPAFHKWEYFRGTVGTNNAASPAWLTATVASGGITNTGSMFLPQTREHFSYDADGNLLSDGRWNYTWDAENRLIEHDEQHQRRAAVSIDVCLRCQGAADAKDGRDQQRHRLRRAVHGQFPIRWVELGGHPQSSIFPDRIIRVGKRPLRLHARSRRCRRIAGSKLFRLFDDQLFPGL